MTTEDTVRYTFFAAMAGSGLLPEKVVLEYPHPTIERAEIDTVILAADGGVDVALEFKYDRTIPSGKNPPSTQKAGEVFSDMCRLVRLPWSCQRYVAYLTDAEMFHYFMSPGNGFSSWFDLPRGEELVLEERFFATRPATFKRHMGPYPGDFSARSTLREDLPREHFLRIYVLHPTARRGGHSEPLKIS